MHLFVFRFIYCEKRYTVKIQTFTLLDKSTDIVFENYLVYCLVPGVST